MNSPNIPTHDVFLNVRTAYRLLHDYQQMVIDAVRYIASQLDIVENAGWSRFAEDARKGGYRYLDQPSWDWLPMMSYEFHFQASGNEPLSLSFLIISDTGFIEGQEAMRGEADVSTYAHTDKSSTKFAFILRNSRNWDPLPFMKDKRQMRNFIKTDGRLPDDLVAAGFVSKCYDMSSLANETEANKIVMDIVDLANSKGLPLERKNK